MSGKALKLMPLMPRPEAETLAPLAAPAEAAAGGHDIRERALGAFFETMGLFLAAQRRFADRFLGRGPAAPDAGRRMPAGGGPLLGEVVEHRPGASLTFVRTYDLDADRFLQDHTLASPRIAYTDPTLRGLPVMPLTVTLEILAEAACALCPGQVVIEFRDVLATRWITFERGARRLRVRAARLEAEAAAFRVDVRDEAGGEGTETGGLRPALAEATVLLADAYPAAPDAALPPLSDGESCDWRGEAIYPDRLFHGPRLRAIRHVTRWAEGGTEGTMTIPPRTGLFRDTTAPVFATDPVLLDAAGAFVGIWSARETYRGVVPFPFRVGSIRCFGPPLPAGTELAVRHAAGKREGDTAQNAIEALNPDGTVHTSIAGWEDRFFNISPAIHRVAHRTLETRLCDDLALPDAAAAATACVTPAFPDDLFEVGFGIWETTLAFCLLTRAEREIWMREQRTAKRRREWLLGRAAAKDAVRRCLAERYGVRVAAADIGIEADEQGKPYAAGAWRDWIDGTIELSIAHSGDIAVAAAAPGAAGGIGIDVEKLKRRTGEGVVNGAFEERERALLDGCGEDREAWVLRLWCAKEALSKALGTGLRGNPRSIVVQDVDTATGEAGLTLTEKWTDAFPDHVGKRFVVRTWTARGCALAIRV